MRHGETVWNAEERFQGQDDSPLSERGVKQASSFVPYARALNPAYVISSDLKRTRHTAELIGHEAAPTDRRLREADLGEWTGRIKSDVLEKERDNYEGWRAGTFTPPKGESWNEFRQRVAAGLRDLIRAGKGDVLAVVHGGVIRAACHEFVGLPPSRVIPVTPGTATILSFSSPESARLEAYNLGTIAPDVSVAD
jgi:probable phosphoglycerate mutase